MHSSQGSEPVQGTKTKTENERNFTRNGNGNENQMVFNCSGTETLFWNPQNRLITFFFVLYIAYTISQKHNLFHGKITIFPVAAFTSPPAKLSCHKFPPPPWREAIWKQQLHWALSSTKVTWANVSPIYRLCIVSCWWASASKFHWHDQTARPLPDDSPHCCLHTAIW